MRGKIEHNIYYKYEDEKDKLNLYGGAWTLNLTELGNDVKKIKKIVYTTSKATYVIDMYKAKKQGLIKVYQGEKKLIIPLKYWTTSTPPSKTAKKPTTPVVRPKPIKPTTLPTTPRRVAPVASEPPKQPITIIKKTSKGGFNKIIILGGGESIKEGITKGLWNRLGEQFTIGCNYSFLHVVPTVLTCVDDKFYMGEDGSIHANKRDFLNNLDKVPLIIAPKGTQIENKTRSNTILVPSMVHKYNGLDSLKMGVYSPTLAGLFATTLAINFLRGYGEIYLLGFDWTRRTKEDKGKFVETHYYKDVFHRGTGLTKFYNFHCPNKKWFKPFLSAKGVKIFNVVGKPDSNINIFQKIKYDEFFEKISVAPSLSQEAMRNYVREIVRRP